MILCYHHTDQHHKADTVWQHGTNRTRSEHPPCMKNHLKNLPTSRHTIQLHHPWALARHHRSQHPHLGHSMSNQRHVVQAGLASTWCTVRRLKHHRRRGSVLGPEDKRTACRVPHRVHHSFLRIDKHSALVKPGATKNAVDIYCRLPLRWNSCMNLLRTARTVLTCRL